MDNRPRSWLRGPWGCALLGLLVYLLAIGGLLFYQQRQNSGQPKKSWAYYLPAGAVQSQDMRSDGLLLLRTAESQICAMREDGTEAWEYKAAAPLYEFTASFQLQKDFVLLALSSHTTVLLSARDGKELATIPAGGVCDPKLAAKPGGRAADLLVQSSRGSWGLSAKGELLWTRPDLCVEEPEERLSLLHGGRLLAVKQVKSQSEVIALDSAGTDVWQYYPWGATGPAKPVQVTAIGDFVFGPQGQIYGLGAESVMSYSAPDKNGMFTWYGYFDQEVKDGLIFALDANGKQLWQHPDRLRYSDWIYPQPDGSLYYLSMRTSLIKLDAGGKELWRRDFPDGLHNFTLSSDGSVYLQLAPQSSSSQPGWLDWLPFNRYNYAQQLDQIIVLNASGHERHRWEMARPNDWLAGALNDDAGFITCEDFTGGGYTDTRDLVCYRWR